MPEYVFKATETYWKALHDLPKDQREAAVEKFEVFKEDPFDPQLKTHRIAKLSANMRRTVYSVRIEGDLRSTFVMDGNVITSLDIGTHDIYK